MDRPIDMFCQLFPTRPRTLPDWPDFISVDVRPLPDLMPTVEVVVTYEEGGATRFVRCTVTSKVVEQLVTDQDYTCFWRNTMSQLRHMAKRAALEDKR